MNVTRLWYARGARFKALARRGRVGLDGLGSLPELGRLALHRPAAAVEGDDKPRPDTKVRRARKFWARLTGVRNFWGSSRSGGLAGSPAPPSGADAAQHSGPCAPPAVPSAASRYRSRSESALSSM